jgi:hypothetical protein
MEYEYFLFFFNYDRLFNMKYINDIYKTSTIYIEKFFYL